MKVVAELAQLDAVVLLRIQEARKRKRKKRRRSGMFLTGFPGGMQVTLCSLLSLTGPGCSHSHTLHRSVTCLVLGVTLLFTRSDEFQLSFWTAEG